MCKIYRKKENLKKKFKNLQTNFVKFTGKSVKFFFQTIQIYSIVKQRNVVQYA